MLSRKIRLDGRLFEVIDAGGSGYCLVKALAIQLIPDWSRDSAHSPLHEELCRAIATHLRTEWDALPDAEKVYFSRADRYNFDRIAYPGGITGINSQLLALIQFPPLMEDTAVHVHCISGDNVYYDNVRYGRGRKEMHILYTPGHYRALKPLPQQYRPTIKGRGGHG